MDKLSEGVIWIAFGYEYLILAAHSAKTLQDNSSDVKTAIFTNIPIKSIKYKDKDLFTYVEYINAPIGENRKWKLSMNILTPFQKTIYLDCDTEICAKIDPLFEILDYRPIAMKYNNYPTKHPVELYGKDNIYYGISHWNSGVIAFQKAEKHVEDFFRGWRDNYIKLNQIADQLSLMKTIYENQEINPLPLSEIWNDRGYSTAETRIHHYGEPYHYFRVTSNLLNTYTNLEVSFTSPTDKIKYERDINRTDKKIVNASKMSFKDGANIVYRPKQKIKSNFINVKGNIKKILNYFGYDIKKL